MSDLEFQDLSTNHKYRTELPNIIFEIGLKPHLIGVYAAIKKCAGDTGSFFKSESKFAKELKISKKTLHKFIEELCLENPVLKKVLIIKENRIDKHGDKDTNLLFITDIWPENYSHEGGRVKFTPPSVKSTLGVGQNLPKGRVKFTHKQEPIKKNPINKTTKDGGVVFFDSLKNDKRLIDKEREDLMKFSEDRIKLALEYSQNVKIKTTLIATLIWHCSLEIPPETKKKKADFRKEVRRLFKHGEVYNGATCWHSGDEMAFERGLTNLKISDKESDYEEKFKKILTRFKIPMENL
jgi:hypothetical protein